MIKELKMKEMLDAIKIFNLIKDTPGMIQEETVKSLSLKSYNKSECEDLYINIANEFGGTLSIKTAIEKWKSQPEKLNKAWWILMYYAETLDPSKVLRSAIEKRLDCLAKNKAFPLPPSDSDGPG
jgi:hypothetical protein